MANSQKNSVYISMHENGTRSDRAAAAGHLLADCNLCPRRCVANRLEEKTGACGIGSWARGASIGPHFGEEQPLVRGCGSGAIFFAECNLGCVFCQNDEIAYLEDPAFPKGP